MFYRSLIILGKSRNWRKKWKNEWFPDRKAWQWFCEIPEWIDQRVKNGFTVDTLEGMRTLPGKSYLLGTSKLVELLATERKAATSSWFTLINEMTDLILPLQKEGYRSMASLDGGETMSIAIGSKDCAPTVGG